ncbi:MAG: NTP transferase domain-containing protein [Candidatus Coatesbacteria bacterium]|nr:NTP transferase domain-containing protein [Candidatus Coatesbacteria bacterium]
MIDYPSMFMVGSAGRNAGKTELACALIRRSCGSHELVGVKVTAVDEMNGECPRGGEGCGICTSLQASFCISEETTGPPGKDTTRMLEAGAARVLWLRCLKSHLEQGARALIQAIGRDTVCVCESNSLRRVLRPGAFIVVREKDSCELKASAEDVLEYADRVVISDGIRFDFDLQRVELLSNRWGIRENAAAIVLAGGASNRMGCDKSLLPVDGRPLIEHVAAQLAPHLDELIISTSDRSVHAIPGAKMVADAETGIGPLMGICTCLQASSKDTNAVVACDIPEVDVLLLRRMIALSEDCDAVIPTRGEGIFEPLFAVYNKSIIPAMRSLLERGSRKISDVFNHARVRYPEIGQTIELKNLNTMTDYRDYIRRHHGVSP